MDKNKIIEECKNLYSDIDSCIDELIKARMSHDTEAEGKALFRMEGLMVGTLQDLSCIENYLENQKAQQPAERVEINKSLRDTVVTELGKYNGENSWKSPWVLDSTGLQYPLYFANLGATWQKEQQSTEVKQRNLK